MRALFSHSHCLMLLLYQFYSYTTCGSTLEDWARIPPLQTLGGITLTAASPKKYFTPYMFKRSPSGDILTTAGNEYYNNR